MVELIVPDSQRLVRNVNRSVRRRLFGREWRGGGSRVEVRWGSQELVEESRDDDVVVRREGDVGGENQCLCRMLRCR